jgi:hypothetical protein
VRRAIAEIRRAQAKPATNPWLVARSVGSSMPVNAVIEKTSLLGKSRHGLVVVLLCPQNLAPKSLKADGSRGLSGRMYMTKERQKT